MPNMKDLFRTAGVAVLLLVAASLLTYKRSNAAAPKSNAPIRGYYLTTGSYDGSHALVACMTGYHMASLWEIHEPSNLSYQTTLGYTTADSGSGPSTNDGGWVRTGYVANAVVSTESGAGVDNCNAWTSNLGTDYGTLVFLDSSFINTVPVSTSPWIGNVNSCNTLRRVWCVQD